MQTVNRMAAIVTPKGQFFEWSKSVLGAESNKCEPDGSCTVFLIPERNDIDRTLREVFSDIFEEMLLASVNAAGRRSGSGRTRP